MHSEMMDVKDTAGALVQRLSDAIDSLSIQGHYDVKCFDSEGNLRWEDTIKNLVVTVGKNDLLDKYFAGTTYTAAWYMGLVSGATTPTYAAGDTLASHAGWTELAAGTAYTGNRITVGWTAASAGSKSSTATTFPIIATNTIAGALLSSVSTGTAGILFSAGNFTGGNRSVVSGDSILVTYSVSI